MIRPEHSERKRMMEPISQQIRKQVFKNLIASGTNCLHNLRSMDRNAQDVNDNLLRDILRKNSLTEYGKRYGFSQIRSYEEYARTVPLTDYADYEDDIRRMSDGGEKNILMAASPDYYIITSGTKGAPKRIPSSREQSKIIRTYTNLYRFGLIYESLGDIWSDGATLCPMEVRVHASEGGTPMAYFSSRMLADLGDLIHFASLSPKEVIWSDPGQDNLYLHLRFGLACEKVSEMNAAYVTVLLELMRYLEANWQELVQDIREGTINEKVSLSFQKREKLIASIEPDPERADALEKEFKKGFEDPILPRIWKKLSLVSAACGASFAPYLKQLQRYTGNDLPVYYHGYTASEAVLGIPVRLNSSWFMLLPDSCFYEFQEFDEKSGMGLEHETGAPLLKMSQLEKGRTYLVIITNRCGLYRYRMHDVVRVVDYHGEIPVIEFLYREDAMLSIGGEHITEDELTEAVFKAAREAQLQLTGFSVYTDSEAKPFGRYVILIEPSGEAALPDPDSLARRIMSILKEENVTVQLTARLGAEFVPVVCWLKQGTYEEYRMWQGNRNLGGNQVKPPQILRRPEQIQFFLDKVQEDRRNL